VFDEIPDLINTKPTFPVGISTFKPVLISTHSPDLITIKGLFSSAFKSKQAEPEVFLSGK
jgi:hypothetical protein